MNEDPKPLSREELATALMNAWRKSVRLPPIRLAEELREVRWQWIAVADEAIRLAPEVRQ